MRVAASAVSHAINGSTIVEDVTFDAGPGELVAVIGPNGSGKSTLLSLLAGRIRTSTGAVTYDGAPVGGFSVGALARVRALLSQQQATDVVFTVRDVVAMGRYPRRGDSQHVTVDETAVSAALDLVDLTGLAHRTVANLSGGERQRVGLARVIAQDTPVVLLDEPTTALDVKHQQLVLHIMRSLGLEGRTVISVLHDLTMATEFDRVLLLEDGAPAALGTPSEVLTSERLTAVYEHPIAVIDHPLRDGILVLPSMEASGQ